MIVGIRRIELPWRLGDFRGAQINGDFPRPTLLLVPFGSGAVLDLVSGAILSDTKWRYTVGANGPYAHPANYQTVTAPISADVDAAPVSCVSLLCGSGVGDGNIAPVRAGAGSSVLFYFSGSAIKAKSSNDSGVAQIDATIKTVSGSWFAGAAMRVTDTEGQQAFADGYLIGEASASTSWASSPTAQFYGGTTGSRIGFQLIAVWDSTDIGSHLCALLSEDPTQLLLQPSIWCPVSSGVASTYALSAATYAPGSITATGVTPRVSVTVA